MRAEAEAVLFVCPCCGLVHEPTAEGLRRVPPLVAAVTSQTAERTPESYLAVWEVLVSFAGDRRRRIFVPAFSLARSVVERLGVRLTQKAPALVALEFPQHPGSTAAADARLFSQILLGRQDDRTLSRFVEVALWLREHGDGGAAPTPDDRLEVCDERLVYLPALCDPRCIHDADWRLLLREFDEPRR